MAIRKQRKSKHPLRVKFADYLSSLDDKELSLRLGEERYSALKSGLLNTSKYTPPAISRNEKGLILNAYSITDLQADDHKAFASFKHLQERQEEGNGD